MSAAVGMLSRGPGEPGLGRTGEPGDRMLSRGPGEPGLGRTGEPGDRTPPGSGDRSAADAGGYEAGQAADAAASRLAASRRRRRSRRRSLSVRPPQMPSSCRVANAHSRHWSRTGQVSHTFLAGPASASVGGKKIAVSRPLHVDLFRHSCCTISCTPISKKRAVVQRSNRRRHSKPDAGAPEGPRQRGFAGAQPPKASSGTKVPRAEPSRAGHAGPHARRQRRPQTRRQRRPHTRRQRQP